MLYYQKLYFRFILGNRKNKLSKLASCKTGDDVFHLYLQLYKCCVMKQPHIQEPTDLHELYRYFIYVEDVNHWSGFHCSSVGQTHFFFLYRSPVCSGQIPGFLLFYVRNSYTESSVSYSFLYLCLQSVTCSPWRLGADYIQTIFLWVFPDQCRGRLENSLHAA